MKSTIKRDIKNLSLTILGCEAEPWDDVWDRIQDLAAAFGAPQVKQAFQDWAEARKGQTLKRPVAEFLKTATGLLRGILTVKEPPEFTKLIYDLVFVANDPRVVFGPEQKADLKQLAKKYSATEIIDAFRQFMITVENTNYSMTRAAKSFTDTADQLMALVRRNKKTQADQEALRARQKEEMRHEADKRLEETFNAEEEEIEETLPQ